MRFEMLPNQIQLEAAKCLREAVISQSINEGDQVIQLASGIRDAFCELFQKGASSVGAKSDGNSDNVLK